MVLLHFELFVVMEKYISCVVHYGLLLNGSTHSTFIKFNLFPILFFLFSLSDCRCTPSPSAEKKRRQRQNKSEEQEALSRGKDRLYKKIDARLKLMSKWHWQGKITD